MKYLIATNAVETSEALCDVVREKLTEADTVYAVNSLRGADKTEERDVEAGKDAIDQIETELESVVDVDSHQLIRGNDPATDVLAFADEHDVDEIVVGIRKRSPTGKIVFGSTAQDVLLNTTIPVLAIPCSD